jgi:hypothetical protein
MTMSEKLPDLDGRIPGDDEHYSWEFILLVIIIQILIVIFYK